VSSYVLYASASLALPLDQAFWQELRQFEEERKMSYVTTGERIGRQEGSASLVLRLLARRVGEVPESVRSQIQSLSVDQLEVLGEALLDFSSLEEATLAVSAKQRA
jgi:predicted transposase YdaD